MNYGKRSSLPKTSRKICDMYDDGEDSKDTTKRKSRNASEKKRRDQFNILIQELCSMVSTKTRKLDKSAVLRATIHFLKAHNDMVIKSEKNAINENWKPSFLSDDEFSQLMLEALDGFMIVFSQQGHILYTSDSVISLLRHLPKDLESCTIYELIHEDDRPEMFKILSQADASCGTPDVLGQRYSFSCHMRRGTLEPDKAPEYEPVRFNGSFTLLKTNQAAFTDLVTTPRYCFVATVRLLSTQLSREMATFTEKGNEFTSRHSLDWKFLFLDHRGPPIIGYLPFEVLGTSVYEYYQQDDLDKLARCHEALMQTGEGVSCYYRFLTKGQEWIWLQTRFFITYNQWNSKPEFIVCTHQVVNYADVRTDVNKELVLTDNTMAGADSDSTNVWDSSASDSASLSTTTNSSLDVTLFNAGSHKSSQSSKYRDGSVSCTSSMQQPRLSQSASQSHHDKSRMSIDSLSEPRSADQQQQQQLHQQQSFVSQPPVPHLYHSNYQAEQQHGATSAEESMSQEQLTVIQLKLQEQLMMRHHKLQDAILRQQQELQQVQHQLMIAQQLMMQHHPMLGQMLQQNQKQVSAEGMMMDAGGSSSQAASPLPPTATAVAAVAQLSPHEVMQHQLSSGSMWPSNNSNSPSSVHLTSGVPSNALQSATRAPFAMHPSNPASQHPSSNPAPHDRAMPHGTGASTQQTRPSVPLLSPHPPLQPAMHPSMSLPPGAQAMPMQDLSCLGIPTLDMPTEQYMHPPNAQDGL